jgi:hypothetical protein
VAGRKKKVDSVYHVPDHTVTGKQRNAVSAATSPSIAVTPSFDSGEEIGPAAEW